MWLRTGGYTVISDPLFLTDLQKKLMRYFYETPALRISLNRAERKNIWDDFVKNRDIKNISHLEKDVPALYFEMEKALTQNQNIQPAVFSECVYAQALAAKFNLSKFEHYLEHVKIDLPGKEEDISKLPKLTVRYSYSSPSGSEVLYQAGGASAVDCALKTEFDEGLAMIELKEPYARTSEPDLPKYTENGLIVTSPEFEEAYPQFKEMLDEQLHQGLNVFEHVGNNVSNFSNESLEKAVTENYAGRKYAHVICTEDKQGRLIMLPSNHVALWAKLEGEIRPSGRNSYKVWTPDHLRKVLLKLGASYNDEVVTLPLSALKTSKARGNSNISRYKINPFFFIRKKEVTIMGDFAQFSLEAIRQLNPSITAKMKFEGLDIKEIQKFYSEWI
jgi:hypothetical protein